MRGIKIGKAKKLIEVSKFSHSDMSDSLGSYDCSMPVFPVTNSWSLLKLTSIESVMPSHQLILFSSCLQSFPASGSFPMSLLFISGGPLYCKFSFSISPSNEYSGLILFRIDWFDLFAVQGTLKSPSPQFKSISSLALSLHMVQLSHPYMTTGKP